MLSGGVFFSNGGAKALQGQMGSKPQTLPSLCKGGNRLGNAAFSTHSSASLSSKFSKQHIDQGNGDYVPLVKMCGITNVEDAVMAVEAGASFVGMILWPKSKRSVPLNVAEQIACATKELGAEPIGVFVDEDASTINAICNSVGLSFAQLHGDDSRSALPSLQSGLSIIYTMHVDKDGTICTKLPPEDSVDWVLLDSLKGGSGQNFDWRSFRTPALNSKKGWLLAGGLNPRNVSEAISILKPDGVDVSSGIAGSDGIKKDPRHISAFIEAVQSWNSPLVSDTGRK